MESHQGSKPSEDEVLALEIGKVFLEAHRAAASVIASTQPQGQVALADSPVRSDATGARTSVETHFAELAAEVDRIERSLEDGRDRLLTVLDQFQASRAAGIVNLRPREAHELLGDVPEQSEWAPQPDEAQTRIGQEADSEFSYRAGESTDTRSDLQAEADVPWSESEPDPWDARAFDEPAHLGWTNSPVEPSDNFAPVGEVTETLPPEGLVDTATANKGASPSTVGSYATPQTGRPEPSLLVGDEAVVEGFPLPAIDTEMDDQTRVSLASFPPPVVDDLLPEVDEPEVDERVDLPSFAPPTLAENPPTLSRRNRKDSRASGSASDAPQRTWLVNAIAAVVVTVIVTIALLLVNTLA